MLFRRLAAPWMAIALTIAPAAPPAAPTADDAVQVRRDHLPVLFEPLGRKTPCDAVAPQQVELTVDGVPLRVTAVGPKPQPRIHALLIDISESMLPRLAETRKAAIEFLDSLPEEDTVIVASFDESLILRAPLGSTRDEQREAVRSLGVGYATALWDGLYHLAVYLESLRGDKVIVVLTDGEDSHSLDPLGQALFARIETMPSVTVFPIGIDLPRLVRGGVAMARGRLGELARVTGGRFFETRDAKGLQPVFRQIRERVEGRMFVSYVPPRVAPGRNARTRVRVDRSTGCRPLLLGSVRVPGKPAAASPGTLPDAAIPVPLPAHLAPADGEASWLRVDVGGGAIGGRIHDIEVERGPLFRVSSANAGRKRVTLDRPTRFDMRRIAVTPPPLDTLVERIHSPADVLLDLLERGLADREAIPVEERTRDERLLHGLIFLHARPALARALYEGRDDYRDWAVRGAEPLVDRALDELTAHDPQVASLAQAGKQSLRAGIREQILDPDDGALSSLLAAWLGDVHTEEAMIDLERHAANRALAGDRGTAERVIGGWPRLRGLLPPATGARVVALLAPAYDPRREVVGFYRLLLSSPRRFGPPTGWVPIRPLGLLTIDWATRDPEVDDRLRGWTVTRSEHRTVTRSRIARGTCPTPRGANERPRRAVEMVFAEPDGGETLVWTSFFHAEEETPSCMRLEPVDGARRQPTRALRAALERRIVVLD